MLISSHLLMKFELTLSGQSWGTLGGPTQSHIGPGPLLLENLALIVTPGFCECHCIRAVQTHRLHIELHLSRCYSNTVRVLTSVHILSGASHCNQSHTLSIRTSEHSWPFFFFPAVWTVHAHRGPLVSG